MSPAARRFWMYFDAVTLMLAMLYVTLACIYASELLTEALLWSFPADLIAGISLMLWVVLTIGMSIWSVNREWLATRLQRLDYYSRSRLCRRLKTGVLIAGGANLLWMVWMAAAAVRRDFSLILIAIVGVSMVAGWSFNALYAVNRLKAL